MGGFLLVLGATLALGIFLPMLFPNYPSASRGMQVLMRLAIIVPFLLIVFALLNSR